MVTLLYKQGLCPGRWQATARGGTFFHRSMGRRHKPWGRLMGLPWDWSYAPRDEGQSLPLSTGCLDQQGSSGMWQALRGHWSPPLTRPWGSKATCLLTVAAVRELETSALEPNDRV